MARVQKLKRDILTYVSAAFAKRPDCEHLKSETTLRANPGFSQSTYEMAINDGFMILR